MTGKDVIRIGLVGAVCRKVGIARIEAAELVPRVLGENCETLAAGESVKLLEFGIIHVRDWARRVGRNPQTEVGVPLKPRRAITLNPSNILKVYVDRAFSPSSRGPKDLERRGRRTA
ncbi:HU family DNA-binding protein [Microvirga sp. VF16]|uniref:HU family DNA-binding protein n=1 Tax=Microvirga sp. VF16 TaxID=2807101 RepID=UPI00193E0BB6|nr:HU family DNA-binding protein [Microvirga sp. VF16]QRM32343.1 HU family DNA-binding protein [Microvirga sp. VF16]